MEVLRETFIWAYAKYLKAEIDRAGKDVVWDKDGLKKAAKLIDPDCLKAMWMRMLKKYDEEYDMGQFDQDQYLDFALTYGDPQKAIWKSWYSELIDTLEDV